MSWLAGLLALSIAAPEDVVGCATRSIFWQDIYHLTYARGENGEEIILDVLHDGRMPKGLPRDWPAKLRQTVEEPMIDAIDQSFARIGRDSRVRIGFDAERGRSYLAIDGERTIDAASRTVYDAVHAMWFGDEPISRRMKRKILNGQCEASG